MNKEGRMKNSPSVAFIGASWLAVGVGILSYNVGLWNADMQLNEKGYYFTVLMLSLIHISKLDHGGVCAPRCSRVSCHPSSLYLY